MTDEQTLLTWAEFVLNSKMTLGLKKHTPLFMNLLPAVTAVTPLRLRTSGLAFLQYLLQLIGPSTFGISLLPLCCLLSLLSPSPEFTSLSVPSRKQEPLQAKLRLHSCGFEGQVITGPTPKFKSILLKFFKLYIPFPHFKYR